MTSGGAASVIPSSGAGASPPSSPVSSKKVSTSVQPQEFFVRAKKLFVSMRESPRDPPRDHIYSVDIFNSCQGVKTELLICGYDDSILVLVTQIGKMGTLLSARKEEAYGGGPTYAVNILMGKRDEPLLVACARQLIENISDSGGTRSLVLSLGLRDHSPKTLRSIVQLVITNKIW